MSTDEMTGAQALSRKQGDLPTLSRHILRRAFEYERHGTFSYIVNFDMPAGRVGQVSSDSTRNEADFFAHFRTTGKADSSIVHWHFIVDNLNSHQSESLVRYVVVETDLPIDMGILVSTDAHVAFLSDPSQCIFFHYTAKHASWMNQIELWFSILSRKFLKRGNFPSVADLKAKALAHVDYFNRTLAKPLPSTYEGKAPAA